MPVREIVTKYDDKDHALIKELKGVVREIDRLEGKRVTIMKRMQRQGFRMREIALHAGLDASTVSRYIRGLRGPAKEEETTSE